MKLWVLIFYYSLFLLQNSYILAGSLLDRSYDADMIENMRLQFIPRRFGRIERWWKSWPRQSPSSFSKVLRHLHLQHEWLKRNCSVWHSSCRRWFGMEHRQVRDCANKMRLVLVCDLWTYFSFSWRRICGSRWRREIYLQSLHRSSNAYKLP